MEALLGQSLWVGYEEPLPPDWLLEQIGKGWVGAVVLFARNIPLLANGDADLAKVVAITDALHEAADAGEQPPLWVAIDQEGGLVQRIKSPLPHWPAMGRIASLDEQKAYDIGYAMGLELGHLGFDVSFAPVLDVNTNPDNPIIGTRAFSSEPDKAAALALAYAQGLRDNDIVPCGKHFPGHGDTTVDSHLALPSVAHDASRWREVEMRPFAAAIEQQIEMLMTAHVMAPALDPDNPATLSPTIIGSLLRDEMNFDGIVVSDDLEMKAIADNYGYGDAAVRALSAGCDALLLCKHQHVQDEVRAAVLEKAENDTALTQKLLQANGRIVAAKEAHLASADALGELVLGDHHAMRDALT